MKAYDNSIRIGKFIFRQDSIPVIAISIGDSYKQLDMPDSALVYYKKAVALNPYKESFVSKAANMLLANKEYDEAISMTEHFLENDPDNDVIAPICGLAYYRKGDYGKAIEIFQKQEDGGNDSYPVHFYLGHAYWRTKTIYKAEKELLAAWQIDSTDANLACSIAGVKSDGFAVFEAEVKPWLDKALEMFGRCGVLVVNNGARTYSGTPQLWKNWRVTRALTDDPAAAKWEDGKLTLAPCAGILLMAEKGQ